MSDKLSDKMREAGKVQADPAVAAIQELSESVATSFEILEKDISAEGKERAAGDDAIGKRVDVIGTQVAAGFKVQSEKLDALERRSMAVGGYRDVEGACLAALNIDDKKDISRIEWSMAADRKDRNAYPILSTPGGATLVAQWLKTSLKIQKRLYGSRDDEAKLFEQLERYEKAFADVYRYEKADALLTTTDALGGHWIPDPVAAELYRLVLDASVFGPLASHVPMGTKSLDLPTEGTSGMTVSWGAENTDITDSMPANATGKVTLTAQRLNGFAKSSLEEIQDSAPSILAWVQAKLTEMAGREIDKQILEGTQFSGQSLLSNTSVNAVTTGANGDALTFATLVELIFKARERSTRQSARFFMAPEAMQKVIGLVDTQGMPIVQYGTVPGPMATSILGFPVEVHSVISAARTYGTGTTLSHVYFGPPNAVVIGDRVGMAWDVSDVPGFRDYSLHMRLVMRLAIGIAVPGAWSRHTNFDV